MADPNKRTWLAESLDDAAVGARINAAQFNMLGEDYLEPRLWEELRQRLQTTYRRVTGEHDAVLTITMRGNDNGR